MEKIDCFKISELTVSGFKCFAEPQTFQFGNMNSITGHNGLGKTSIAEAVAYVITGVPFFGSEQSLDRLYALESKDIEVELVIELADGSAHRLTRSRSKDQTTITYDGIPIRQSDLTIMFGEKDVFLSIFNPLYFIEELGDKGRNVLERYLPAVPHGDVLEQLCEPHRALLGQVQMHSPEALLEKVRTEFREMESGITYLEGQRDLLHTQGLENQEKLAQKQSELEQAETELAQLEEKRVYDLDMTLFQNLLVEYNQQLEAAPAIISSYTQEIAAAAARFEQVKKQYNQERAILEGLKPGICCVMCKQAVTEQNIGAVRQEFTASINDLIGEGQQLLTQLATLTDQENKAKAALQELRGKIERTQAALEYGNLGEDDVHRLTTLRQAKEDIESEIGYLNAPNTSTPEAKQQELLSLQAAVTEKRELENAVKFYIAERVKLMFTDFDLLQRVKIMLYEVVKSTGEVKNVFRFSYDGKPYRYLSLSEKIKAGLEISELLKRLTKSAYPVFIDNGESVPVIDNIRPSGQVFISQVVKAAPLHVQILDGVTPAARKAA